MALSQSHFDLCLGEHLLVAIEQYCDDKPHLSAIKSLPPAEEFSKSIGTEVTLKCAEGYLQDSKDGVKATCVVDSAEKGKWESDGECLCDELESNAFSASFNVFNLLFQLVYI